MQLIVAMIALPVPADEGVVKSLAERRLGILMLKPLDGNDDVDEQILRQLVVGIAGLKHLILRRKGVHVDRQLPQLVRRCSILSANFSDVGGGQDLAGLDGMIDDGVDDGIRSLAVVEPCRELVALDKIAEDVGDLVFWRPGSRDAGLDVALVELQSSEVARWRFDDLLRCMVEEERGAADHLRGIQVDVVKRAVQEIDTDF